MNRYVALIQFLFICVCASAQTEIVYVHKNINTNYLQIGDFKSRVTAKIPFKNISVIDERFDTSKIGYFRRGENFYYQLKLKTSWDRILNSYYRDILDNFSKYELVIVLKRYWKPFSIFSRGLGLDEGSMFLSPSPIITEVDIYAKSDSGYHSLFRFEKTYEELYIGKVRQKLMGNFFLPFDSIMNRLSRPGILALLPTRKLISTEDFSNYYAQRKKIPILNNSFINKGIFYKYEDFKSNKPKDVPFVIKKSKTTDEVYIKENGEEKLLADFWAICDGNKLLVRLGLNVFMAVPVGNTFEMFGGGLIFQAGGGEWTPTRVGSFQLPYFSTTEVYYEILQLDIDKGKWY